MELIDFIPFKELTLLAGYDRGVYENFARKAQLGNERATVHVFVCNIQV